MSWSSLYLGRPQSYIHSIIGISCFLAFFLCHQYRDHNDLGGEYLKGSLNLRIITGLYGVDLNPAFIYSSEQDKKISDNIPESMVLSLSFLGCSDGYDQDSGES